MAGINTEENPSMASFIVAKKQMCFSTKPLSACECAQHVNDGCSSMSKQYNNWYSTKYGIENLMIVPYFISIVREEWKKYVCYLLAECVAEAERILRVHFLLICLSEKKVSECLADCLVIK